MVNAQERISEGLDSLKAWGGGIVLGAIGAAAAKSLGLSELDIVFLGIIGWLAGTLGSAYLVGWQKVAAALEAVQTQTSVDKTTVIQKLHDFADEGTDSLLNRKVHSEEDVKVLRESLRDWKQRFLDYLNGKILLSEYRRLHRLDTFRVRGMSGISAEHAHVKEMTIEWVTRLRALADRLEEPPPKQDQVTVNTGAFRH